MWYLILMIAIGLVLLQQGAGWFVEGSAGLARRFHISELAIGLTIVAFGTSAPELVVNTVASLNGNPDIVLGNIIGSNSFNLFIILSVAGLIIPLRVKSGTAWREIPFSFAALVILFLVANDALLFKRTESAITRLDGLILLICFLLFMAYILTQLKKDPVILGINHRDLPKWKLALLIVAGLAGLVAGGRLVLDHAVKLATQLGMSEKMIGLTIVAAGTSLPELATSLVAALKRSNDIAVGNIIGSNIFNIFFILGISAIVRPLPYQTGFNLDVAVLGGGNALLLLAMYTGKKLTIDRWEAFIMITLYMMYFVFILM
jgi:cation:H+ antiporter